MGQIHKYAKSCPFAFAAPLIDEYWCYDCNRGGIEKPLPSLIN
jgi:hypothetical protein